LRRRAIAALATFAMAGSYFDRNAAHCRAGVSFVFAGTSGLSKL
jgi:hypothetical protein